MCVCILKRKYFRMGLMKKLIWMWNTGLEWYESCKIVMYGIIFIHLTNSVDFRTHPEYGRKKKVNFLLRIFFIQLFWYRCKCITTKIRSCISARFVDIIWNDICFNKARLFFVSINSTPKRRLKYNSQMFDSNRFC